MPYDAQIIFFELRRVSRLDVSRALFLEGGRGAWRAVYTCGCTDHGIQTRIDGVLLVRVMMGG